MSQDPAASSERAVRWTLMFEARVVFSLLNVAAVKKALREPLSICYVTICDNLCVAVSGKIVCIIILASVT